MKFQRTLWLFLLAAAGAFSVASAFSIGKERPPRIATRQSIPLVQRGQSLLWLASDDGDKQETEDEMFNRLLKKRIAELESDEKEKDLSEQQQQQQQTKRPSFQIGTYEMLAILVSAFFVATATLSGGTLFAPTPTPSTPKVILDADEILREDFSRDTSSVPFSGNVDESSP